MNSQHTRLLLEAWTDAHILLQCLKLVDQMCASDKEAANSIEVHSLGLGLPRPLYAPTGVKVLP